MLCLCQVHPWQVGHHPETLCLRVESSPPKNQSKTQGTWINPICSTSITKRLYGAIFIQRLMHWFAYIHGTCFTPKMRRQTLKYFLYILNCHSLYPLCLKVIADLESPQELAFPGARIFQTDNSLDAIVNSCICFNMAFAFNLFLETFKL